MRIKSLSLAAAFLALSAFTPRDVAASGAEIAHLRIAVLPRRSTAQPSWIHTTR